MNKFSKIFILFLTILFTSLTPTFSQDVLKGYVQKVPEDFFGVWRVNSQRIETDNPTKFKEKNLDLWNISQEFNVIKLSNPFTGANAQIQVEDSNQKNIKFVKSDKYANKILTDRVEITIVEDKFTGYDTLELVTYSQIDNSIQKKEFAKYIIKGEKIAGQKLKGD